MYDERDVALGEFSTVSAAAGLRYSGKYPLKQRKEHPYKQFGLCSRP